MECPCSSHGREVASPWDMPACMAQPSMAISEPEWVRGSADDVANEIQENLCVIGALQTYVEPREAAQQESRSNFVAKPCMTMSEPEWFQGSVDEAAKKVEDNPDKYYGYVVKKGLDWGVFLCVVGQGLYKTGPEWTAYLHTQYEARAVHRAYRSLQEGALFDDGFRPSDMMGCDALRPGRGQGLHDHYDELCLFNDIMPEDLRQGQISNCWLIGAMSACCQQPQLVRKRCNQQALSLDGCYDVTLFHPGDNDWITVSVDDRLPVDEHGRINFVKMTVKGEIWPCIYEKAFAKFAGGYQALSRNSPLLALKMLTGSMDDDLLSIMFEEAEGVWKCYSHNFTGYRQDKLISSCWPDDLSADTRSTAQIVILLETFCKQGCMMVVDDGGRHGEMLPDRSNLINKHGLGLTHAYALLDVRTNVAGSGYDLMKFSNTWADGQWNGAWSAGSDMWQRHTRVRDALSHESANGGVFWMTADDFATEFGHIYVCLGDSAIKARREQQSVQAADHRDRAKRFLAKPSMTMSEPEWFHGSADDAAKKAEDNSDKYYGYIVKDGVDWGTFLCVVGRELRKSGPEWKAYVLQSYVEAKEAEQQERASHFVAKPNMAMSEPEWFQGSVDDAAKKVEDNPDKYYGYILKEGVDWGVFLCVVGQELRKFGPEWKSYVLQSYVGAKEAEQQERASHFVAKPNMTMSVPEWFHGSIEDAAKKVEDNPDTYYGYIIKDGVDWGAFLCIVGQELHTCGPEWTAYIHKSYV